MSDPQLLSGLVLARTVMQLADLHVLEAALTIAERAKKRERKTAAACPYTEEDLRRAKPGDDTLHHVIRWATDSRAEPAIPPESIERCRELLKRCEVQARVIHLSAGRTAKPAPVAGGPDWIEPGEEDWSAPPGVSPEGGS